MSTVIPVT